MSWRAWPTARWSGGAATCSLQQQSHPATSHAPPTPLHCRHFQALGFRIVDFKFNNGWVATVTFTNQPDVDAVLAMRHCVNGRLLSVSAQSTERYRRLAQMHPSSPVDPPLAGLPVADLPDTIVTGTLQPLPGPLASWITQARHEFLASMRCAPPPFLLNWQGYCTTLSTPRFSRFKSDSFSRQGCGRCGRVCRQRGAGPWMCASLARGRWSRGRCPLRVMQWAWSVRSRWKRIRLSEVGAGVGETRPTCLNHPGRIKIKTPRNVIQSHYLAYESARNNTCAACTTHRASTFASLVPAKLYRANRTQKTHRIVARR